MERVAACIRQHHPQYSNETVFQHLEESVRSGQIQRSENKGKVTYKDPESGPRGKSKHGLKLGPSVDITKIFVKAVRELGESGGSNLRTVEKYINSCYDVELEQVRLQNNHYFTLVILPLKKNIQSVLHSHKYVTLLHLHSAIKKKTEL